MSANRYVFFALALLLLVEGGIVWSEWNELAVLTALTVRDSQLRGQVAREEASLAKLRAAADAAEAKRRSAQSATRAAPGSPGGGRAATLGAGIQLSGRAFIAALDDKTFLAALKTVDRDYNERTAGPFLRSLGLSPDQVSRMLDLMGDRMIAMMDANQAANAEGLDGPSRRALIQQTEQDSTNQIQAYLSPQNFAAFLQWNQQVGVRAIASNLQTALSFSGNPLTDAATQQLAQVLFQSIPEGQKPDAFGLGALAPLGGPIQPPITSAEIEAAQALLSPPQSAALQQMAEGQRLIRMLQRAGAL